MIDQHHEQINVDHLFRHQYGKMVATLSRFLGMAYLDVVEDIVQETFIQSIQSWRHDKYPHNPEAWLMTVAKRKAIDYIRKVKSDKTRESNWSLTGPSSAYVEEFFTEKEIGDNQLKMIFACCHPQLKAHDQIALTLNIVSGFGIKEIASALRMNDERIKKRLQRAKAFLRSNQIKLEIPSGKSLSNRRKIVALSLYLIFNEGYFSQSNEQVIRKELCYEAMRLCRMLTEHKIAHHPDISALMALMCFHAARFESRLSKENEIILLEDQDRTTYDNTRLIAVGQFHLQQSYDTSQLGAFHFEAAISAEHCKATSFENTNWNKILNLYRMLYAIKPSEQVLLNQVIVLIQLDRINSAREIIESINPDEKDRVLFHSVFALLREKNDDITGAIEQLRMASECSPTQHQKRFFNRKISVLNNIV